VGRFANVSPGITQNTSLSKVNSNLKTAPSKVSDGLTPPGPFLHLQPVCAASRTCRVNHPCDILDAWLNRRNWELCNIRCTSKNISYAFVFSSAISKLISVQIFVTE